MPNSGIKRSIAALLCLALCAGFSGCKEKAQVVPEIQLSSLQPPTQEEAIQQSFTADLYFAAPDNRKLSVETRKLTLAPGAGRAETAVQALLEGPRSQSVQSIAQWGIRYDSIEISDTICNVYLAGDVELDQKQWLITRDAVASTVFAAEDMTFVNLYYNGMAPGFKGRPLGAIGPIAETLDTYVRNIELEYEALEEERGGTAENTSYEIRNCALYYLDESESWLLPEGGLVSYEGAASIDSIAATLITRLWMNEDADNPHRSAVPADLVMQEPPVLFLPAPEDAAAEDATLPHTEVQAMTAPAVLELTLKEPTEAYDTDLMAAAITLTLTGYLPQIEGVRIRIQPETGDVYALNGGEPLTRAMYMRKVGKTITLAYPQEDGVAFSSASRCVESREAYDLRTHLTAYLQANSSLGVLCADIDAMDIRSVYLSGDTAIVDWKTGLSQKLAAMKDADCSLPKERRVWLFVYGVINTLTQTPGVQRVWMLENGEKLGTVGDMYLGNALLRNPGAYAETTGES